MPAVVRLRMPDGVTRMGRRRPRPRELRQRGHRRPGPAQVRRVSHLPPRGRRRRSPDGDQPRHPLRRVDPVDAETPCAVCGIRLGRRRASRTCPAVLGPDHQKLSKRRGARNVLEYGELGYLPSAIVNAIALLGWSSGDEQEVFTPEELCERFTLERVNAAAAIFDPEATRRSQRHPHPAHEHRRRSSRRSSSTLPGTSKETRRPLIPMLRERMVTLADATRLCAPLLGDVTLDAERRVPAEEGRPGDRRGDDRRLHRGGRGRRPRRTTTRCSSGSARWPRRPGVKSRDAFRVLYVAILGTPAGLPVIEAMEFLGQGEVAAAAPRGARPARLTVAQGSEPGAVDPRADVALGRRAAACGPAGARRAHAGRTRSRRDSRRAGGAPGACASRRALTGAERPARLRRGRCRGSRRRLGVDAVVRGCADALARAVRPGAGPRGRARSRDPRPRRRPRSRSPARAQRTARARKGRRRRPGWDDGERTTAAARAARCGRGTVVCDGHVTRLCDSVGQVADQTPIQV